MSYLSDGHGDLQEVGVGGFVLPGDDLNVFSEDGDYIIHVGAREDQFNSLTLPDLDVTLVHVEIVEDQGQSGDGHHLRNSTKVEDGLVLDLG